MKLMALAAQAQLGGLCQFLDKKPVLLRRQNVFHAVVKLKKWNLTILKRNHFVK